MIRFFRLYFPIRTVFLAVSEALLLAMALVAAHAWWTPDQIRPWEDGWRLATGWLVCVLCMYYYDLYDSLALQSFQEGMGRLIQVIGTACVILVTIFYLYPSAQWGRKTMLTWVTLSIVCIGAWRMGFLVLNNAQQLSKRVLLVGSTKLTRQLLDEISLRQELGLRPVGLVATGDDEARIPSLPVVGQVSDLPALIDQERASVVVLCFSDRRTPLPVDELLNLKSRGVEILDGCRLFETSTGRLALDAIQPVSLLFADGFRLSLPFRIYKRAFGLLFSTLGLIPALPLMALIAVIVKLDSPGPAIFRQRRIGKNGRPFWLYKFRSMYHSNGPVAPAQRDDDRFTRVGKWLRRTRMDELPQLINILRGDMCFIGPRPFEIEMEMGLAEQIPLYRQRWNIWPGATGWAQVERGYCSTLEDNIDKLSYDLYYIKHVSFAFDLAILLKTAKILLLWRGSR